LFAHEKLQVYSKPPDFAAKAAAWTSTWDKKQQFLFESFLLGEYALSNPSLRWAVRSLRFAA
jgi:hypothetical protein